SHIPAARITVDALEGPKVTRREILGHYQRLRTSPDEALLFFYGGHGATDPATGRPALTPSQEQRWPVRPEGRQATEAQSAGLVVLISDCCSDSKEVARVQRRADKRPRSPRAIHPTFRRLFFESRGTVDINSSSRESAWGDNDKGGVFTRSLCRALTAQQ